MKICDKNFNNLNFNKKFIYNNIYILNLFYLSVKNKYILR